MKKKKSKIETISCGKDITDMLKEGENVPFNYARMLEDSIK